MQRDEVVAPSAGDGSVSARTSGTEASPSGPVLWISYLSCLILSSVLFAGLSEWQVYTEVLPNHAANLTFVERGVLFWLLTAKSMALFFPFLLLSAGFLWLGWKRVSSWFFTASWILVFYWMMTDLFSFRFSGSHIAEYAPNIADILSAPQEQQWQWIGKGLLLEAAVMFGAVSLAAIGTLILVKWLMVRSTKRFILFRRPLGVCVVTTLYVLGVLGVLPALGALLSDDLLHIVYGVMPIDTHLLESSVFGCREFREILNGTGTVTSPNVAMQRPSASGDIGGELILQNMTSSTLDLTGWRVQDPVGRREALAGVLKPAQGTRVCLSMRNQVSEGDFLVVDQSGWLRYRGRPIQGAVFPRLLLRESKSSLDCSPNVNVDEEEALLDKRLVDDAADAKPVDYRALISHKPLPNVILIVIESFRHTAIGPEMMPRLDRIAENGLRLCRHYSASNISQLGIYSLLYGRSGITYHSTLEKRTPSQLCFSLKRSGYRRSFVTSGEMAAWRRMDEIFSSANFDNVVRLPGSHGKNWLASSDDWPSDDRWKLREALRIASQASEEPQFVFTFLMSTHYSYACPPEFQTYTPCDLPSVVRWRTKADLEILGNRYKNSALFLEDELLKLISQLDLKKNVVVITGDHGESLGEDGVTVHGSRASEIQLRTPLVMLGAGISGMKMPSATTHADLMPTLLHVLEGKHVPVKHTHGRDLLETMPNVDQAVVTPYKQQHKTDTLLIIHGENRSLFRALPKTQAGPAVGFSAFLDESGNPKPDFSCGRSSTETTVPSK